MQIQYSLAQYSAIFITTRSSTETRNLAESVGPNCRFGFTHSLKTNQYGRQRIMARREFQAQVHMREDNQARNFDFELCIERGTCSYADRLF
jgi:hypothetical protein